MAYLEYQTSLTSWFEADSLIGQAPDSEILSWTSRNDMSGLIGVPTITLTAGAGAAPRYRENVLNGHAVADFDGAASVLNSTTVWSTLVAAGAGTIIAVAAPDVIDSNNATANLNDAIVHSNTANNPGLFLRNNAGAYTYYAYANNGAGFNAAATPANPLLPNIYAWRYNNVGVWANINDAYVKTTGAGAGPINVGGTVRVGLNAGGTAYFDGKLAALLTYTIQLTDANLGKVFAYLEAKYFGPSTTAVSPLLRGDGTEQARDAGWRRLLEREQRAADIWWTGGLELLDWQIGDDVYLQHGDGPDPLGAGGGWPESAPKAHRVIRVEQVSPSRARILARPL